MFNINKLDTNNINFLNNLKNLIKKNYTEIKLENYIKNIIFNIKKFKDKALLYYTNKFDKKNISKNEIEINKNLLEKSFYKLNYKTRFNLESSKNRIKLFHEDQKNKFFKSWKNIEYDGNILGQKLNPIKNIGLYVPGGETIYPSSIFMNFIPAEVSNCENIVIVSPSKSDIILGSLFLLKANKFYNIGGIQSIASLSYGNKLIEKVDKICGPGNIFVTLSKKILFGDIGIDVIAGPSELTIFSNNINKINIKDLFSQSEHDKLSQSIIISTNDIFLKNLYKNLNFLNSFNYNKNLIKSSIKNKSILIKSNNILESCNLINYISPEHLILFDYDYKYLFKYIRNSGSVFLNKYTSESFGDYNSGLNHVLPTYQNSKFCSPLGIYNFYKKNNFLKLSKKGFYKLFYNSLNFSFSEKLFSHYESILKRF